MSGFVTATIWTCPTPGCGDYYGTTDTPDLRRVMNRQRHQDGGEPTFPRSQCPSCRGRGVEADRVPVVVQVPRPRANARGAA